MSQNKYSAFWDSWREREQATRAALQAYEKDPHTNKFPFSHRTAQIDTAAPKVPAVAAPAVVPSVTPSHPQFQLGQRVATPYGRGHVKAVREGGYEVVLEWATAYMQAAHVSKDKEVWQLSLSDRYREARQLKEEGALLFKAKDFRGAALKYQQAVTLLHQTPRPGEFVELQSSCLHLRLLSLSNLSLCLLKLDMHSDAVAVCSQVLQQDPQNAKCLYRRGVAYHKLHDLDQSLADLKQAVKLAPGDKEIRKALEALKADMTEYLKKEKNMYRKVFSDPPANLSRGSSTTSCLSDTHTVKTVAKSNGNDNDSLNTQTESTISSLFRTVVPVAAVSLAVGVLFWFLKRRAKSSNS